jgi:hypothetical protein
MPNIPELPSGHVTLDVECLDRLYLNGKSGGQFEFTRDKTVYVNHYYF